MNPINVPNLIANLVANIVQEEERKKQQATAVAAEVIAREVQPAPAKPARTYYAPGAPSPQPAVTALPDTGTGPVAPVTPQPQATPPYGGGGPTAPPPPSLGDQIGGILAPLNQASDAARDAITGAVGYERPANPLDNVGNALQGPQDAILTDQGQDAYYYVTGNPQGLEKLAMENTPFKRILYEWAAKNPDLVKTVYAKGYDSRDGQTKFMGGRAVWEAFAREHLTFDTSKGIGPGIAFENIPAVLTSIATDPWNLLGGPGKKIGTGVATKGAELAAAGLDGNAGKLIAGTGLELLGKGIAAPDIALERAISGLGAGIGMVASPVMSRARETRIGGQVGRWFEASPRALAERKLNQTLAALRQRDTALASAGREIVDPNATTPLPEPPLEPGISPPDLTPVTSPASIPAVSPNEGITTAGHRLGPPLPSGDAGVTRRTVGTEDAPLAHLDHKGGRGGAKPWTVRLTGASRGKRFESESEALAYIDAQLPAPSIDSDAATNLMAEGVPVATVTPPRVQYEEQFSPTKGSNRTKAGERFDAKMAELIDLAPDDESRRIITEKHNEAFQNRLAILETTEAPGDVLDLSLHPGRDIRNTANRYDLWLEDFLAEQYARDVLNAKGVALPPFRNTQPRGGYGAALDTIAWNPDEAVADTAYQRIMGQIAEADAKLGPNNVVSTSMNNALDAAVENRSRFAAAEDVGEEAIAAVDNLVDDGDNAPVGEIVDDPDAHLGAFNDGDRAAWKQALSQTNGRQSEFKVADYRLRYASRAVEVAFEGGSDDAYLSALDGYKGAQDSANRLLETVKRDNDLLDEAFARGEISPATHAALTDGDNGARTALQASDESFRLGPIIAPELEANLLETFSANNVEQFGRTYEEVADEIADKVVADKNQLVTLLAGPTSQLEKKQVTLLNKLKKEYGIERLDEALALNTDDMFRRRLRDEFYKETGYEGSRFGGLDTASRIFSSVNLLMPWKFPAYYLGNLLGDTWQVGLTYGGEAAAVINNPEHVKNMTRYALKGGNPLEGAIGDLVRRSGLGGYHPQLIGDNFTEAMFRNEQKAVRRAGGPSRLNLLGGIDKVTGRVIDPFRNINNGLEWAHRTGLWAWNFQKNVINAAPTYLQEMDGLLTKHGISHEDAADVFRGVGVIDGAEVAHAFGKLAADKGVPMSEVKGFAEEMGRKWASRVNKANDEALGQVNKALFNYEQKNIDMVARRVAPYTMWISRAYPFFGEQALRHPGLAASYYSLYEQTKESAEANGWPAPLQTMLKLTSGPGGLMTMINPLAAIGLMDVAFESNGGYTPENISAVGSVLNRASEFGFSLLPWWSAALNWTGYLGDSPIGLDPIGTYNARKFVGTILKGVGVEAGIGPLAGAGKPFEQMLINMRSVVSGMGLPGSEWVPPTDASQMPLGQVRQVMLRNELADRGMTMNQYLQLIMAAEGDATSPEAMAVDEIHSSITSEEVNAGADYLRAVKEVSRGEVLQSLIAAFVPGPKSYRQEDALGLRGVSDQMFAGEDGQPAVIPGVGPVPERDPAEALMLAGGFKPGISNASERTIANMDARDVEFLMKWEERFGTEYRKGDIDRVMQAALRANTLQSLTPQAATLVEANEQWRSIGTEEERAALDEYYAIGFGDSGLSLPSQGINATREQLAALDQETRWALADMWMLDQDKSGEIANLRELRDLFASTHPEYGAYRQWKTDTSKQWGNSHAFRLAAVKTNPAYRLFIEQETAKGRRNGLTPSEIEEKLDEEATSLDGYMAYSGIQKSRFTAMPGTGTAPLPLASEGAPVDALGSGGRGGGSGTPWPERVRLALLETQAARKAQRAILGVSLDEIPPDMRPFYEAQLPEEALPPSDAWIYREYVTFFQARQGSGEDSSVDAFIQWSEEQQNAGLDTETVTNYQPGVWPPVAIAS